MTLVRRITLAGFLSLGACGGPLTYTPHGTPRAPEADGHITANVNHEQGSTRIQLQVEHLAPPDRIVSGTTAYVVWERRDGSHPWTRIGTLVYNNGARVGELDATAADQAFDLQITAEPTATPATPADGVVLAQRVGAAP
jgi:hypothetical protein